MLPLNTMPASRDSAGGDASAALVGFEPDAPYFHRSFSPGPYTHFRSHVSERETLSLSDVGGQRKRLIIPFVSHLHLYYTTL